MRLSFLKPVVFVSLIGLIAVSCGAPNLAVNAEPISPTGEIPVKTAELSEEELKTWPYADLASEGIPGMSVEKAYNEIIEPAEVEGETVIVAVLDSGVDDEHEDLDGVIWTNEDEIPNNNIDDDKNGYVDDIHGWNFLGDIVGANLNFTRIVRQYKPQFEGKSESEISPEKMEEYKLYKKAEKVWGEKHSQALQRKNYYQMIADQMDSFSKAIDRKNFTAEDLKTMEMTPEQLKSIGMESEAFKQKKGMLLNIMQRSGEDFAEIREQIQGGLDYFNDQLEYHYNLDFKAREIINDDYHDWNARGYGNNDVDGPEEDEEHVMHGTHVSGIIAAERNNGIGMNGVANNVEIMVIRAVPNGDEYDKDIALGIRYAVDNGADIINASFGKSFSSHPEWVIDALKYAAENDVLFVHAAGNDATNVDTERFFPNDQWPEHKEEVSDNVLTVGAIGYEYDKGLVAGFSNYGATNVDVFAPGMEIYSSTPLDTYKYLQGTSMAAPEVAGVAAVIMSYYPKLSAAQVKDIIMKSGIPVEIEVVVPGGEEELVPFSKLSVSGKIANLYNALILADKVADQ